jgi:uncharacterized protein YydD (DUF2326 family)
LKQIYEDIQVVFPNKVLSEFSALIEFNKQVSEERITILKTNLKENQLELTKIESEIESLNDEKVIKLNYLTQFDSYKKIKEYQKELSGKESEILILEHQLELVNRSLNLVEKMNDLDIDINARIKDIQLEIKTQKHNAIRIFFNAIIKGILSTTALISLKQNRQGNIEFSANIQNPSDKSITEEDYGTSYKKLMCMAFDLALLENYANESFYRFAYHDGALEGLDNRKKYLFLIYPGKSVKNIIYSI